MVDAPLRYSKGTAARCAPSARQRAAEGPTQPPPLRRYYGCVAAERRRGPPSVHPSAVSAAKAHPSYPVAEASRQQPCAPPPAPSLAALLALPVGLPGEAPSAAVSFYAARHFTCALEQRAARITRDMRLQRGLGRAHLPAALIRGALLRDACLAAPAPPAALRLLRRCRLRRLPGAGPRRAWAPPPWGPPPSWCVTLLCSRLGISNGSGELDIDSLA